MVQSQLSAYSGSDPIWGFVALVGSELFTGEAAVGLDPRIRLFAVDGRIYFAEREDDAPVATRLVNCGVISAMQLARGTVQAGGSESLARLFQRDPTIDRDAVELTIESATESLLAAVAHNPVGMPEVFPLRHHSSGIHHWLRRPPVGVVPEEVVGEAEPVVAEPVVIAEEIVAPAPQPALPEWPRADEEPVWAVPTEPAAPVLAEPTPFALTPLPIKAAELPQLAPLGSIQVQPTTIEAVAPAATAPAATAPAVSVLPPPVEAAPAPVTDPLLPKLAAGPVSMKDLKLAAATSEPWNATSNNMAAVQIWEMVDDLFDDGQKSETRVGGGAPEARAKGWLRKKS